MAVILNQIADILNRPDRILKNCAISGLVNKNGLGPSCPGATPDAKLANLRADKILNYFKNYDHSANKKAVGDSYAGGIVVYADPGPHGGGITMHPTATATGFFGWPIRHNAFSPSIYSGYANTRNIVENDPYNPSRIPVADTVWNAVTGGYSDWYIPSINELQEAYRHNTVLNLSGRYWSSTEADLVSYTSAYYFDFTFGIVGQGSKNNTYKAMYCRTF